MACETVRCRTSATDLDSAAGRQVMELLEALHAEGHTLVVFPDGRVLVQGTTDEALARTLHARYIGS